MAKIDDRKLAGFVLRAGARATSLEEALKSIELMIPIQIILLTLLIPITSAQANESGSGAICTEATEYRKNRREEFVRNNMKLHIDPATGGKDYNSNLFQEARSEFTKIGQEAEKIAGSSIQESAKKLCEQKIAAGKKIDPPKAMTDKDMGKAVGEQCKSYDDAMAPYKGGIKSYQEYIDSLNKQADSIRKKISELVKRDEVALQKLQTSIKNTGYAQIETRVSPLLEKLVSERENVLKQNRARDRGEETGISDRMTSYFRVLEGEKRTAQEKIKAFTDGNKELQALRDKCSSHLTENFRKATDDVTKSQLDTSAKAQKAHYAELQKFAKEQGLKLPPGCLRGVYGNCANHVAAMRQLYYSGNTEMFNSYNQKLSAGGVKVGKQNFDPYGLQFGK
jgi:hypothetical protein